MNPPHKLQRTHVNSRQLKSITYEKSETRKDNLKSFQRRQDNPRSLQPITSRLPNKPNSPKNIVNMKIPKRYQKKFFSRK